MTPTEAKTELLAVRESLEAIARYEPLPSCNALALEAKEALRKLDAVIKNMTMGDAALPNAPDKYASDASLASICQSRR